MTNKQKGFYWHVHHDRLIEWCHDYQERVDYIKRNKSRNEIKTRLRLFKPVKHPKKLPREFIEIRKKYDEAWKKYDEAKKKCDEAWKKYGFFNGFYLLDIRRYFRFVFNGEYDEARKKCDEAWKKYSHELKRLHKEECGCKEWNGKKLVFK